MSAPVHRNGAGDRDRNGEARARISRRPWYRKLRRARILVGRNGRAAKGVGSTVSVSANDPGRDGASWWRGHHAPGEAQPGPLSQRSEGYAVLQKIFFPPTSSSQSAGEAFTGRLMLRTQDRDPVSGPAVARAQIAALFVAAYLAFSVPALIAGVATTNFGLQPTALVYSAALAALIAAAAGILLLRPGEQLPRPTPTAREVMPPGPCTCPRACKPWSRWTRQAGKTVKSAC
jgi:hypothetical protein